MMSKAKATIIYRMRMKREPVTDQWKINARTHRIEKKNISKAKLTTNRVCVFITDMTIQQFCIIIIQWMVRSGRGGLFDGCLFMRLSHLKDCIQNYSAQKIMLSFFSLKNNANYEVEETVAVIHYIQYWISWSFESFYYILMIIITFCRK